MCLRLSKELWAFQQERFPLCEPERSALRSAFVSSCVSVRLPFKRRHSTLGYIATSPVDHTSNALTQHS